MLVFSLKSTTNSHQAKGGRRDNSIFKDFVGTMLGDKEKALAVENAKKQAMEEVKRDAEAKSSSWASRLLGWRYLLNLLGLYFIIIIIIIIIIILFSYYYITCQAQLHLSLCEMASHSSSFLPGIGIGQKHKQHNSNSTITTAAATTQHHQLDFRHWHRKLAVQKQNL